MKYIDDFLEYLEVVKKHSEHTITNYKVDLTEYLKYTNCKINIDKGEVNTYLKYLYEYYILKLSIVN